MAPTAPVVDLETHRQSSELVREVERVSRALATFSLNAELAVARHDWLGFHEAAEVVKELSARFAELRTKLLSQGFTRPRVYPERGLGRAAVTVNNQGRPVGEPP
jgi:hypothetical protein